MFISINRVSHSIIICARYMFHVLLHVKLLLFHFNMTVVRDFHKFTCLLTDDG